MSAVAATAERTGERQAETLGRSFAVFRSYRSPQIIAAALVAAGIVRIALGGWRWGDLLIAAIIVALLPFIEWFTHVVLLHWKPKKVLGMTLDPVAAREHRKHHLDPRDVKLIFIPLPVLIPNLIGGAVLFFLLAPTATQALSGLVTSFSLLMLYEWTHFLIHSRYRPTSRLYRYVWRAHRLHHYRNERYWFGVTVHLADHLFGTFPDKNAVPVSATARTLGVS
jgi:Fatty acid hydroxylase superfamily